MAMLLGLANSDIPRTPDEFTDSLIEGWAELGVRCLSVAFASPAEEVTHKADALRGRLAASGIHVAQMAGVNANLVHPDPVVRQLARTAVRAAIPAAVALDATMISSGCGTTRDDWERNFYGPAAGNFTADAEGRLIDGLREIAPLIEDAGLSYTIECHQLTTMRSPEVIREVLDAVDSPAVTANFDPVNLLDGARAVYDNAAGMRTMVDVVGPRYGASCHLKDVRVTDDFVCRVVEVPPGEGELDYAAYFEAAARLPGPTAVIVEHLRPEQTASALRYVRARAGELGVELS